MLSQIKNNTKSPMASSIVTVTKIKMGPVKKG
jgi:hypothetical protein